MKVLFFWESVGGLTLQHRCNPYAGLLAQALDKRDVHLELGDYAFERDWLERRRADHEILHLHWLHLFYRADDLQTTVKRYCHFAENLTFARQLGYRIVWTMHNFYPHDRPFPEVDHLVRLLVCRLADAVIAHCHYAADLAQKRFYYNGAVHVIPHGHFIDAFTNDVSPQDARKRLNLPQDAFVYLFFGNARTYKSVETLIEAFANVAAADARLVLMMRHSSNPGYAEHLRMQAKRDERVHMFSSDYFPESDFQFYLNSADIVVLPFSEVLTSGSAIAALSFGKPVIVPKIGCLPELIDDTMGLLYDPKHARGLEDALIEIRKRDLLAAGHAALQRARELDWDDIAFRLAKVYQA